jgi:hypothetical protein
MSNLESLWKCEVRQKYKFYFISLQVLLEDINECEEYENLCQNGHCTNTFGSFMCLCNDGFRLDESNALCVGRLYIRN